MKKLNVFIITLVSCFVFLGIVVLTNSCMIYDRCYTIACRATIINYINKTCEPGDTECEAFKVQAREFAKKENDNTTCDDYEECRNLCEKIRCKKRPNDKCLDCKK